MGDRTFDFDHQHTQPNGDMGDRIFVFDHQPTQLEVRQQNQDDPSDELEGLNT